jgi:hypothetical protein
MTVEKRRTFGRPIPHANYLACVGGTPYSKPNQYGPVWAVQLALDEACHKARVGLCANISI